MNKHLAYYLHSFKLGKQFWYTFLIDALTLIFLTFLFLGFGKVLEVQAYNLSGGKTTEELKVALLSGTVDSNQVFLHHLQFFLVLLTGGSILVLLVALLFFSYSRAVVWNGILLQKFSWKRYWRWNGLVVVVAVLLLLYLLLFVAVRSILNLAGAALSPTAFGIISTIFNIIFIFAFLIFAFFVDYSFVQKYKVWESMGEGFHLIKVHWSKIWRLFVLAVLTGMVISILSSLALRALGYQPQWVSAMVSLTVLVLLISWARLYVVHLLQRNV